jgi:hypothetical protein
LIDTIEMLKLLSHLVSLLIEFLDFNFTGSNITLKFLDFVIEDELEFFKLLSLLFQIINSLILVADGSLSFLDLTLL